MRKLLFILLLLPFAVSGQVSYQLNYDSIRVGKTAGTGGTSLYGKTYLKNVSARAVGDSILTVVNGRIFKVPFSGVNLWTRSGTTLSPRTANDSLNIGTGIYKGHGAKSDGSGGFLIESSTGVDVGRFGVANTANASLFGGLTLTGNLTANSDIYYSLYGSLGRSGTDFTSVGYNVDYTTTNNSYNYKSSDFASMWQFPSGGAILKGAVSGTTGNPITFTDLVDVSASGAMSVLGNVTAPAFIGALTGNASTATTLQTTRTIWGQNFNGSANVTGDLTLGASQIRINTNFTGTELAGSIYQRGGDGIVIWPVGGSTNDLTIYNKTASASVLLLPTGTNYLTTNTPTAGDNTTKIATTAFLNTYAPSGTYTPTLTNGTNVASSTAFLCHYTRIGNQVTVTGRIGVTPTSASTVATELGISLPISSAMTDPQDLNGGGWATNYLLVSPPYIQGDSTNDRASYNFTALVASSPQMTFTFSYLVK
jgi:hypothetical protein